jgi:hypothetical protein
MKNNGNWITEYRGVKSIEYHQELYDKSFGRESIKSDIFIFNFGKLGHPINAFGWYLVDDDLKIMYYGFNQVLEEYAKDEILKCFSAIHPSSSGYLERLKLKIQKA